MTKIKMKCRNTVVFRFLKIVILFFFVYDVCFQGIPTIFSSRKIAFFSLVLIFLYKYGKKGIRRNIFHEKIVRWMYLAEILIMSAAVPYLIWRADCYGVLGSIGCEYPYVVYFIIFSLLSPVLFVYLFDSGQELWYASGMIGIVQSVFVWCEYAIWPLKEWLQVHILSTSNVKYTAADRATGLGASGSALTVILAYSVFALGMIILNHSKNIWYWYATWFVISAQFLSGRTGFYISLLNIGLILIMNKKMEGLKSNFLKSCIAFGSVFLALSVWISLFQVNPDQVNYIINRNLSTERVLSSKKDSFYHNLKNAEVPQMKENVLLGIGINYGETNNGLVIANDSGYIKRYVAEGVLFATMEYVCLLLLFLRLLSRIGDKRKRFYIFWMIAALYVIEIKEPYIYYYVIVTIVLTILLKESESGVMATKN